LLKLDAVIEKSWRSLNCRRQEADSALDSARLAAHGRHSHAELGVQPHIVEAVLNHVSGHKGGVAGIYNRATYDKEKREALNL